MLFGFERYGYKQWIHLGFNDSSIDHSQDTEQENNDVYIQLVHVAWILTERQANYPHFQYLLAQC